MARLAGWNDEAEAAWNAGQRTDALIKALFAIDLTPEPPAGLFAQAGYYAYLTGDFGAALRALRQGVERFPDDLEMRQNLGMAAIKAGEPEAARDTLLAYLDKGGSDANAYDGLCKASEMLGDVEAARSWGRKSLQAKTREAERTAPPLSFGKPREAGERIVSFSLWGDQPRYLRGAVHNALRMPEVYPDFRARFVVDASVPGDVLSALRRLGAQVRVEDGIPSLRHHLTRRFLVADDPGVQLYLVRDCDSLINAREAAAVREWRASGKPFHVMRDWLTHTDPMLAGMWGGVGGVLPPLAPLIADYRSGMLDTPSWDQWFLRARIWPAIRKRALVHCRTSGLSGTQPFPTPDPPPPLHVGINEFAAFPAEQAAALAPFREAVPSLKL